MPRVGGGEGGIRTLGTRESTTVFETAPFDHSGTSPIPDRSSRLASNKRALPTGARRLAEAAHYAKAALGLGL